MRNFCVLMQELQQAILEDMVQLGKESGLHSFEQVKWNTSFTVVRQAICLYRRGICQHLWCYYKSLLQLYMMFLERALLLASCIYSFRKMYLLWFCFPCIFEIWIKFSESFGCRGQNLNWGYGSSPDGQPEVKINICRSLTFLPLKALLEIGSLITALIPNLKMLLVTLFSVWALILSCLCKYFCNRSTNTSEGEIWNQSGIR